MDFPWLCNSLPEGSRHPDGVQAALAPAVKGTEAAERCLRGFAGNGDVPARAAKVDPRQVVLGRFWTWEIMGANDVLPYCTM